MYTILSLMKEIELKILNVDVPAMRRKLKKLGLKRVMKPTLLHEIHFISENFRGKGSRASLFRLRKEGGRSFLTVKAKRRKDKRFDVRQETEVSVSDFEKTKKILEAVGFKILREREKFREEYKGKGVKVEIDSYPKIKPYAEVEGNDKKTVLKFLSTLGYSLKDTTNKTATGVLKEAGIGDGKLVFKKQKEKI